MSGYSLPQQPPAKVARPTPNPTCPAKPPSPPPPHIVRQGELTDRFPYPGLRRADHPVPRSVGGHTDPWDARRSPRARPFEALPGQLLQLPDGVASPDVRPPPPPGADMRRPPRRVLRVEGGEGGTERAEAPGS